ncbi:hypothetical protein Poli38472_008050 [Pythium oligandrum]|uniref:Apple domain-containing protein n=1 Tax=Pythium oligandrum TaxID=41045 RepID=A0A8K1CNA9_PYTOL|nr:hypothetical protein Poli38472_008050 [Pythium oligandrum]|eukprot:TMW65408.1 hypothetical protein Poli38472_008050 [Pythium oligandrum]
MKLLATISLVIAITATATTVDASSLRSVNDTERHLAKMEYMAAMAPTPNCVIEHGFDYIGYDIKSVQGQPVENCCQACATTDGCRAYSWTNQNGGTCWLKSGRGEIVSNPNVKSALFSTTANNNTTCQLANDLDYVGNDIGRASASDAGQCCDICQKRSGCRAYTWTGQDGGTCWLKSKRGETTYKAGAKSAEAYPVDSGNNSPPPAKCDLVKDVDFVGNDIGSPEPGATADQCCTICKSRPACKAFTWTNQNGGTCYLKNGVSSQASKPGAVSSVIG